MPMYSSKPGARHDDVPRLGILVTNLGTPDAPTTPALRRYLAEFLGDPRVVEINRVLWWLLLHGVILRTRPKKSAAAYAEVWEEGGSPLLTIGKDQVAGIDARLQERLDGPVSVKLAMRYGNPSIREGLQALRDEGAERILVLPLYPQYSATTVGSTYDAVFDELKKWRRIPELRLVGQYHDDPGYIDALANTIREHREANGKPEKMLFSFHGMPRRYLINGDNYHCQCQKTARLVAEKLELADDEWQVTFQSLFGREVWLKPYTDETVKSLAESGMKTLDVICPGFSADCLETLEEIEGENAEIFEDNGGESLRYIRALNARDDHLNMLTDLVVDHLQGWPEADPSVKRSRRDPQATLERARAMGSGQWMDE